jgi:hypothetical protein
MRRVVQIWHTRSCRGFGIVQIHCKRSRAHPVSAPAAARALATGGLLDARAARQDGTAPTPLGGLPLPASAGWVKQPHTRPALQGLVSLSDAPRSPGCGRGSAQDLRTGRGRGPRRRGDDVGGLRGRPGRPAMSSEGGARVSAGGVVMSGAFAGGRPAGRRDQTCRGLRWASPDGRRCRPRAGRASRWAGDDVGGPAVSVLDSPRWRPGGGCVSPRAATTPWADRKGSVRPADLAATRSERSPAGAAVRTEADPGGAIP